jgi:hypothetical protein
VLASFFLPGLGSIVNGEGVKGAVIMVSYFVALLLTLVLIGFPLAFGVWIWGMVDAYSSAQKWNARHGIIS